jgi:hypothetical protein
MNVDIMELNRYVIPRLLKFEVTKFKFSVLGLGQMGSGS